MIYCWTNKFSLHTKNNRWRLQHKNRIHRKSPIHDCDVLFMQNIARCSSPKTIRRMKWLNNCQLTWWHKITDFMEMSSPLSESFVHLLKPSKDGNIAAGYHTHRVYCAPAWRFCFLLQNFTSLFNKHKKCSQGLSGNLKSFNEFLSFRGFVTCQWTFFKNLKMRLNSAAIEKTFIELKALIVQLKHATAYNGT